MLGRRASWALLGGLAWGAFSCFVACAPAATSKGHLVGDASAYSDPGFGRPGLPDPQTPTYEDPDSSLLSVGEHPRDAAAPVPDGGVRPGDDAGPLVQTDGGACPPLGPGDLAIVEIMISSRPGSGDQAEWVEIQSTRTNCTLNLKGLHIESPRGALGPDAVDIGGDVYLEANDSIVVADSDQASINGNLPGRVFSWGASDALANDGDTITVSRDGKVIDTLTYGSLSPHPGRTVSFSVDCAWAVRSDWARWAWSNHPYTTAPDGGAGLEGTPNADNDDVACPSL